MPIDQEQKKQVSLLNAMNAQFIDGGKKVC
jgi:hypothetical protein